jgi:hypothetical protein
MRDMFCDSFVLIIENAGRSNWLRVFAETSWVYVADALTSYK